MKFTALVIAAILLVGTASGSPSWIGPESSLYPLKVWAEKLSLNLIFNQTERAQKMLDMAEERLDEAEAENGSRARERAMEEYAAGLEELQNAMNEDAHNKTENIRASIRERMEDHKNRTKALKNAGNISVLQQSIIQASGGGSRIEVSAVGGNVSVHTEGGNATVTRDGGNVTVVSVTNSSRQVVVIRTSQNSSSSSVMVQSSSSAVSEAISESRG